MVNNPYETPRARVADVVSEDVAPALWNPNSTALWSLLFSPAFGAYLQMKNWQALGDEKLATTSLRWFIAVIVVVLAATFISIFLPESRFLDALDRGMGIGLLVAWYLTSGRVQVKYVKDKYGNDYPRKSWTIPLFLALFAWLAFFGVLVGVVTVMTT